MVTICTTSLTFNNSTFCPHSVFMCFVWISEQTAIISLYNINWVVFTCITETECVYCAVRTGSLNVIQVIFRLLPSPVSTIPPTLHTHLHLHVSPTRRTNGRSLGTFQNPNSLTEISGTLVKHFLSFRLQTFHCGSPSELPTPVSGRTASEL